MLSILRPVSSVLLSYVLLISANGMFASLLGLRSIHEGFETNLIGIIMSGTFVGMLIGAIYAVRMVANVGHIRAFAALASIMSVAVLAHVLIIDPIVWFLLRVIAGFCLSGMTMIVESWLNEGAGNKVRGQIMSLYMVTNYLGYAIGQFLLLLDKPENSEPFIIASIVLSLALVPILMTRTKAPTPKIAERLPLRKLFMISPLGIVGVFGAGMLNSPVNSLGAVFAQKAGLNHNEIPVFVASLVIGGMALQYPIGRLSDKYDRRTVILTVLALTVFLALLLTVSMTQTLPLLAMNAFIYGAIAYTIYPLSSAQMNDLAPPDQRVQIASGVMVAFGGGAIIGPIISSQAMEIFGASGLFYYTSFVAAILGFFTLIRMIKRVPQADAAKRKSMFLPISGTGISSKQLYKSTIERLVKDRKIKNNKPEK